MIDPRGIPILNATYDSLYDLSSLTDAYGKAASVGTGSLSADGDSQGVTDATGNTTETIYDPQGDVTRTITTLKDASGNITGYSVSATNYNYYSSDVTNDLFNIFVSTDGDGAVPGSANVNSLMSVQQYQTFTVPYPDPSGLRYTELPSVMVQETDYYNDFANPAETQQRQLTYVGTSGTSTLYQVEIYSNFKLGKPQNTSEQIEIRDAQGNLLTVA